MVSSSPTLEQDTAIGPFRPDAFAAIEAAGEPAILQQKRREAAQAFASTPAPTVRDEEWRRTDPALFPFADAKRLPDLPVGAPAKGDALDAQFDIVVDVTDSAFSIKDQTGAGKAGTCFVLSLRDAAAKFPEILEEYLQGAALPATPRKFAALVDAYWNVGLFVYVPKGRVLEKGILVRYSHKAEKGAILPRLLVVVEDGGEARMVEHFSSPDDATVLCIGSREFYVGQNAHLHLVSALEWGAKTYHIGEDWARVARDGKINWVTLTLGGKVCKLMVGSDVSEANAQALLSGVFFADGEQHFDQRTLQLHSSPDTYSYLLYKGAVKDKGHSVYQGVINAKPGAIRVDAYQMNNNLILTEGARADSLPGLEIDADDLKCSHGSTMGTLDPEQIHYLRTRGLSLTDAKRLVVTGFFEDVVSKVPYEFLQERLREHIQVKIGDV